MTRSDRQRQSRRRWNARLRQDGLAMSKGASPDHVYPLTGDEDQALSSQGLVSSVYGLAPSGDYFSDDERDLRCKKAIQALLRTRTLAETSSAVEASLSHGAGMRSDDSVKTRLRKYLSGSTGEPS